MPQLHLPENIDLTQKITDFKGYLNTTPRIILSARFGDGKSYFLRTLQERPDIIDEYDFYTIFPVNYTVAKNEDIFEYIKRDIIYQLNEKELISKFDIDAFVSSVSSLVNLKMLAEILAPLVPGGDLFSKVFSKLKDKYDEEKRDKDDYLHLFEEQKGSIYERDGYTALINTVLDYIKHPLHGEKSKKPVLIIEDLDRLDPHHLFRILNIISAHFDNQNPVGQQNKFNFDNIILVLDYDTTEHIFHHFYGQQANYEGYMKKFLFREPFRYSIREMCIFDVKHQLARNLDIRFLFPKMQNVNNKMNAMSMRDLAKFCNFRVEAHIKDDVFSWNELNISTHLPLFKFYLYAIEIGLTLNQIVEDLSITPNDEREMEEYLRFILPILFMKQNSSTVYIEYKEDVFVGQGDYEDGIVNRLSTGHACSYDAPIVYHSKIIQEPIRLSFDYFRNVLNLAGLKS